MYRYIYKLYMHGWIHLYRYLYSISRLNYHDPLGGIFINTYLYVGVYINDLMKQ
jgi:hypothetical protein